MAMAGLCLANNMNTMCKTYSMVNRPNVVAYKHLLRSQKPECYWSVSSVNIVHKISLRLGGKSYRTAIRATSVDKEDSSEVPINFICHSLSVHRISLRLGGKSYRTAVRATSVDKEDSSEVPINFIHSLFVHRISLRLGGKSYRTANRATSVDKEDSSEGLDSGYGTCDPLCSVDEMDSLDYAANYKPKTDLLKALTIIGSVAVGAAAINHSWVTDNQDLAMVLVFALGYAGIIFEESLAFNKSGVGLLMAVSLWVIRSIGASSPDIAVGELTTTSAEVSEIVFFLLGAMTIVEIIDAHQGFKLVTDNITTRNPRLLLWVIGIITFFLSSILDNLTSTIVMVSLLRKLIPDPNYRRFVGGVVVIAANAGGAWTPIGDVTTTMLWIHGQISTLRTMKDLFLPAAVSLIVPLALMSLTSEVNRRQEVPDLNASEQMAPRGQLVFSVGIGALLFVPVFKALTGLPPFLGILFGLGVLWILTDAIHYGDSERQRLKVPQALSRIDTQGILFFLGILFSVGSLQSAGILKELANYLDSHIPSIELIASSIGIASAVIDNVPLVAATMGMYDKVDYPVDSELWQLIAYCAGTGGSMLIIGSAAGVAFMGMEKVDFFWYLKKVSGFAFAGYAAGVAAYIASHNFHLPSTTTLVQLPFLSG